MSIPQMSKFKVLVNGKSFLLNLEGREQKVGFYVTRIVEAATAGEAESATIELLKADEYLKSSTLNEKTDSPMLYVEEIIEVSRRKKGEDANTGYSFYRESE
jgi:hypothetical protein